MENMQIYKVYPAIPDSLSFLNYLARNLWWCWNHDAIELFHRINPALWEDVGKNPLVFLARISQRRFEVLSNDESFLGHLNRVRAKFEKMFSDDVQIPAFESETKENIVYFSMEFGLHESLPFFAGGLGVLAGDHLKASSALGVPLIGIGLLFREGYFRQYLDQNGWQLETYPIIDVFDLPVQKVTNSNGEDLIIEIPGPHEVIRACAWQIRIGRTRLLLLDTDLLGNSPDVRDITARLYAGQSDTRLAQEVLLGIGGIKVLYALGILPDVCHLNEGHCAFAALERVSMIMDRFQLDFEAAFQINLRSTVFTTHTPVAAGHDMFDPKLVAPYLTPYIERFGIREEKMVSWGKPPNDLKNPKFSMFVFGAKFSGFINGVSRLHGQVARQMWQELWPKRYVEEIPISHVTNGIHINSYISRQKNILFERYLAADWAGRQSDPNLVSRIDNIEDSDLWHAHELDRSNLIRKCRKALLAQYERRNAPRNMLDEVAEALDHRALTICFARRFATYKRAGLLLKDIPRLTRLITDQDRPIQFVFAGKAHPNDNEGKEIIKQIVEFARRHEVRHNVAFLENYDINVARYMVQGADIWLNTPRRPYEACGTSGMKAAANGGLNLSILDGWWCEGFREDRGWAIGNGEHYEDPDYQDEVESLALFNILENEVIPAFYDRKRGNPPVRWIKLMKESMKMAIMEYSSDHMVREYANRYYIPAIKYIRELTENGAQKAKDLAKARERLHTLWGSIRLSPPTPVAPADFHVGDMFTITVKVDLGRLSPEEVEVQLYHGRLSGAGRLEGSRPETMHLKQTIDQTRYLYECTVSCSDSGRFGYTARVIPGGDIVMRQTPGLITWAHGKE
jgi:starch phosphorylase